jgi:histone deacetylase 1/2
MKVKGATDSLTAIREPVSKQDQVMNLLGGLGSDYNAIITAINIRDDKILVEAIHIMLLAFENRLEQQSSADQISTMTANYASSSNNRGGGRKYNGSRGHNYTSYTPNASNYNYRGGGRGGRYTQNGRHNSISSEKPQCQLCGEFGHTVHVCYHKFDISYANSSNSGINSLNMNIRNQNNILVMVASSNNLTDDNWYLNFGASHHLTQNVENLTNFTPYIGTDKVIVGNGKHLSISNIGSHRLVSNSRSF